VNQFLVALPLSATTRHNIRRELLTLWRFAHEEGLTNEPPLRVRRIKASPSAPEAWSLGDLSRMLRCAEEDKTVVNQKTGVAVKDVLPAWIMLGFESGLRLHDLLELRAENYRNGCVTVRAHKTGKVAVRRLTLRCRAMLETLLSRSPDGTVFRWTIPRRRAIKTWRAFLDRHNIPGSSKWLRRSAATQLESVEPGAAAKFLDHSNPAVARRHYIDQTLLGSAPAPRTPW
jgi:integrase